MPHHGNTPTFEATFKKDKNAFVEAFLEIRNHFQENEKSLLHIISKNVIEENAANSVKKARKIGKAQFEKFVVEKINVTPSQCMIQLLKRKEFSITLK